MLRRDFLRKVLGASALTLAPVVVLASKPKMHKIKANWNIDDGVIREIANPDPKNYLVGYQGRTKQDAGFYYAPFPPSYLNGWKA